MSCYHPLLARPTGEITANGKKDYEILPKFSGKIDPGDISIPCGKCIGCRLDYSRQWADRMCLELDHSKTAVFLTLTYDNDHVHWTEDEETGELGALTLDKRDAQLFMKRLRKWSDSIGKKNLKFYCAGEYGSSTFRPHLHFIIFGLSIDDFPDRTIRGKNELGQLHYSSGILSDLWENGFVLLADTSWQTFAYVSRYVQKKVFSGYNYFVEKFGAEPEFSLMSRRPGIGSHYLEDNPGQIDCSSWYVRGNKQAIRPSRYYTEKIFLSDPEKYDSIKKEKAMFADDRQYLKFLKTDLSLCEQLEIEENEKLRKARCLPRYLND